MLSNSSRYALVILFVIGLLCLSACGARPTMDVTLTDAQISLIEDGLVSTGDSPYQKTVGQQFVSIHIIGTAYTTESQFDIYAWELSQNLILDNGKVVEDGGASRAIIITAQITHDELEIIDIHYSADGGSLIFPTELANYADGRKYYNVLQNKNLEKAGDFYGI